MAWSGPTRNPVPLQGRDLEVMQGLLLRSHCLLKGINRSASKNKWINAICYPLRIRLSTALSHDSPPLPLAVRALTCPVRAMARHEETRGFFGGYRIEHI